MITHKIRKLSKSGVCLDFFPNNFGRGELVGGFSPIEKPRLPVIPPEVFTVFGWYVLGGPNDTPSRSVFGSHPGKYWSIFSQASPIVGPPATHHKNPVSRMGMVREAYESLKKNPNIMTSQVSQVYASKKLMAGIRWVPKCRNRNMFECKAVLEKTYKKSNLPLNSFCLFVCLFVCLFPTNFGSGELLGG